MGEEEPLGLRERKKLRTRQTIARVAFELFEKQGFHATTISQIAEAAEVSPRTVSAYFPVKEDLAFTGATQQFERLRVCLENREPGQTTADSLRAWIANELEQWIDREAELRRRRALIDSEEDLIAYERRVRARAERMLAESVARDLGLSPDDLEPRMAAAAATAVFEVIGKPAKQGAVERLEKDGSECGAELHAEAMQLIDRGLTFIGGGIQALADRPAD